MIIRCDRTRVDRAGVKAIHYVVLDPKAEAPPGRCRVAREVRAWQTLGKSSVFAGLTRQNGCATAKTPTAAGRRTPGRRARVRGTGSCAAFSCSKEAPNLDRLRSCLAKHRQVDGGCASQFSGTFDTGGAYFCATVDRWTRLLQGEPAIVETAEDVPLFDGKSLEGRERGTSLWSVCNGMLIDRSDGLKQNEFLATTRSYRDFVLKLTFRLVGGKGNSGVQFQSVRVPGTEMSGYQAGIGEKYRGCLYNESRRNRVLAQAL